MKSAILVILGLLAFGQMMVAQPVITSQPASTSAAVGSTVGFSVAATGIGTIYYQWRKNGTNMINGSVANAATVSGATTAALTLTGITTNNADIYSCRITNTSGSVTSSIATLTVIVPPSFISQPKSTNVVTGGNALFSCGAAGSGPFTYQWYKDGSPISGATLNTYSISGVFVSDSGAYAVRVSNSAGSATSSNAVLNVGAPITITAQPASLIVTQGQSASFSVSATGTSPAYYWRKNGAFIPGQTNNSLAFASSVPTNAATYTCTVSNFFGAITSSGATLTVQYPPSISVQPVSQTIGVGSNFTVRVTASGNPTPAYQWRRNGLPLSNATNASYSVTGAQTNDAGAYDVILTNTLGSVTSTVANVSVLYYPPTLTQQPVGGNIAAGTAFTLTATASGTAPLNWQWFKDGAALTNAATVTTNLTGNATFGYTNAPTQLADAGSYWVVVTNGTGSVTSGVAVVNVGYPPIITQQPVSQTNVLGGANLFTCVVTGSPPINLQWTRNGNPIAGATNASLTLTNLQPADIGYYALTATNAFGGTVSSNAALHLDGYDFGLWNGLVAYYPFNGNANDASGNGHNGAIYNAALTFGRFGDTNSSFRFNGTNAYINLGNGINPSQFTISAWVYVVDSAKAGAQGIVSKLNDLYLYQNWEFRIDPNFTLLALVAHGGFWPQLNSQTVLSKGRWSSVMMTFDGSVSRFYINGVKDPNELASTLIQSDSEVMIGARPRNNNCCVDPSFSGSIDDVRIYNRALSSDEVASLYAVEADLPVITQQPQVQTIAAGGTAIFTVSATAANPLTYQWFKDGIALGNATNTSLTLSNVQPNQIGYYSVTVSNGVAGVTSSNAALNLNGYSFSQWQGLVAYYPFNGNANDESGNGNNGSGSGGISLVSNRFTSASSAMSFDGVDARIAVNPSPTLSFPREQYSFSCWVWFNQTTRITDGYDWQALFSKHNIDNMGLMLATEGGNLLRSYSYYGAATTFSWPNVASNRWFNVVLVRGSDTTLFVDGKSLGTFPNVGTIGANTNSLLNLGYNDAAGSPYPLDGKLDDVRIYNRALSSNEVAYLYQLESQVTPVAPLNLTASLGAGPSLNLIVAGLPDRSYILQTSTNLSSPTVWTPVATNTTDTNGLWQYLETNLTAPQQFYRVHAP